MKAQICDTISSPSSKLAMHKGSHVISKLKPKIRIIHIYAPEIIKTDVANFRELVQRLTGKPAEKVRDNKKKVSVAIPTIEYSRTICPKPSKINIMDTRDGIQILQNGEQIKKEKRDLWGGGENSNGFLGGFVEIDSLFQDLSEFPFLPMRSSHMNMFGDMPLS